MVSVQTTTHVRASVPRLVGLAVLYGLWPVVVLLGIAPWMTGKADAHTLLVVKAALVAVGLVVITVRSDRRRPLGALLGAAVAGYALCPFTWAGRGFMGQLWYSPGVATVLFDLIAWVAVVLAAAVVVRQADRLDR